MTAFSRFVRIDMPTGLVCEASGKNPEFEIAFSADGEIPFAQVIVHANGSHHLINGAAIRPAPAVESAAEYVADVPAGLAGQVGS